MAKGIILFLVLWVVISGLMIIRVKLSRHQKNSRNKFIIAGMLSFIAVIIIFVLETV